MSLWGHFNSRRKHKRELPPSPKKKKKKNKAKDWEPFPRTLLLTLNLPNGGGRQREKVVSYKITKWSQFATFVRASCDIWRKLSQRDSWGKNSSCARSDRAGWPFVVENLKDHWSQLAGGALALTCPAPLKHRGSEKHGSATAVPCCWKYNSLLTLGWRFVQIAPAYAVSVKCGTTSSSCCHGKHNLRTKLAAPVGGS